MELALSTADAAFQKEVRDFIAAELPGDIKAKVERGQRLGKDDYVRWQKILSERGWLAPNWPLEHGGTGWTPLQRHLFEEELALASTPRIMPFGLAMVAPVIMAFGDAAQKEHYLPRILSSEDWWCQGYSEPGAGSDLASLTTKAVADGEDYIVSGAKTWTTLAQYADMIFCLVRTSNDGKPQQGITFLLIDMQSSGVSVRPIRTLDGGEDASDGLLVEQTDLGVLELTGPLVEILSGRHPLIAEAGKCGREGPPVSEEGRLQVPVGAGSKGAPLRFALDDNPHGNTLYSAGAQAGLDLLPQDRRQRVAIEPIQDAPTLLRPDQVVVHLRRVTQGLVDRLLGDLVKHDTTHRHLRLQHFPQVPADRLALAVGVRCEQ